MPAPIITPVPSATDPVRDNFCSLLDGESPSMLGSFREVSAQVKREVVGSVEMATREFVTNQLTGPDAVVACSGSGHRLSNARHPRRAPLLGF
ncbi:hypothetical protein GCM10027404_12750 [Arthrobacter tumbae]